MQQALRQVRILHVAFVLTWFLFILVVRTADSVPGRASLPAFFPVVLGFVCISGAGIAMVFRARLLVAAESVLRSDPENRSATAKWRLGNLISFCFAESITLSGLLLKFLGFDWKIAAIFFAGGLLLLLLWAPRKIQTMPRGVR